jgi:NAD(P)-dependent dehydrogenase (short-subunit alcohol dehydrogenase family)
MILVTGATGVNGNALLRRLSAGGVMVRALVRNPAKAEAIAALPHVEIAQGDMARPETLAAALRDVDRAMLISSSDPMMLEVQSNFIDAAAKAGVRHVVKLVRHHARARFGVSVRPDAWRDRKKAGGLGDGVHASARRRVHDGLLPADPDDCRQGRDVPADGGRQDRIDRCR